LGEVLTSGIKS
jgi:hypothetical protein